MSTISNGQKAKQSNEISLISLLSLLWHCYVSNKSIHLIIDFYLFFYSKLLTGCLKRITQPLCDQANAN